MLIFFFFFLQQILIYDDNDVSPGCYQSKRGSGDKTKTNDIFTNMFSYFGNEVFGKTGVFSSLKLCGIEELVPMRTFYLFLYFSFFL